MKITHIIFSFITGGAETMLIDIVNEQVKKAEVKIIIINKIYNKELINKINENVIVHFINRHPHSKNPLSIVRLNRLLYQLKSDIIHCHNHNIICLLLPSFKNRSVLTVHDTGIKSNNFKFYNKLFAISNSVKMDIEKRTGLKTILIYNGIAIDKIRSKEKNDIKENFKIVVVSRLRHLKKGQHLVIEALYLLKKQGVTNIIVDFIGVEIIKGESENYLRNLVQEYNLSNNIFFLGYRDRDFVYANLCDYNLLIQPSLFEGFGLTVAEGIAARIPVLVSNIEGPIEIIDYGQHGYWFQSGDPEQLANQIMFIYNSYGTLGLKQKISSAYLHVKNNFNIITTSKNYLDNY